MTVANAKPDLLITGPLGTTTVNAASSLWSAYTGVEAKITAAIAYAVSIGAKMVYVPDCFLPYTASLVTFNTAVKMTCEGMDPSTFNLRAYGADATGVASWDAAIQGALAGAAAVTGGTVVVPDGGLYKCTATVTVGTATAPVRLLLGQDVQINVTITNGTDVFVVANGSGIVGANVGSTGTRRGGSTILLADGANVSRIITNASKGAGGQSYIQLERLFVDGGTVGQTTVTVAGIDLEAVLGQAITRDLYVLRVPAPGIRLASNALAVAGPFTLVNCWIDGQQATGAIPLRLVGTTNSLLGVTVLGGAITGPGVNQAAIEINGSAANIDSLRDIFIVTYIELRTTGNTGISCIDCSNVVVEATEVNNIVGTASTGCLISQTGAGRTKNIHLIGFRTSGSNIVGISNTITSEALGSSSRLFPFYTFYGSGAGVAVDGAVFSVGGAAACASTMGNYDASVTNAESYVVAGAGRRGHVIKNAQDALFNAIDIIAGVTADQTAEIRFLTHLAAAGMALYRLGSGTFRLQDEANNKTRIEVIPGSSMSLNADGTGLIDHNVASGSGTGGSRFGDGAGAVKATIDAAGKIVSGADPGGTDQVRIGGALTINVASPMIRTKTAFTNGAAAAAGTLTNAPAAGNPTKWIPIDDAGVTRFIPAW